MTDFFSNKEKNISNHKWTLEYDAESHTAKFVNTRGKSMDVGTMGYCLEALKNQAYDLNERNFRKQETTPLDELSKRRKGVVEYNLISDEVMSSRSILEAYGDDNGIFAIDKFRVYQNRRVYDEDSPIYLGYPEAKELLKTLQEYTNRIKHIYGD